MEIDNVIRDRAVYYEETGEIVAILSASKGPDFAYIRSFFSELGISRKAFRGVQELPRQHLMESICARPAIR